MRSTGSTMLHRATRASEVRAPSTATQFSTTELGGLRYGLSDMLDGDKKWRDAYYSNIWTYRCVQVIAEDVGTLPLRVGPDPTEPGNYDVRHPLAVMLGPPPGSPNPTTSARSLMLWTIVQRLISGAFAWEIEYGPSGLPMFLWPVPENRVKPVPTDGGSEYFKGYKVDTGGGKFKNLTAKQMVYAHRPSATDWRKPESVLQAAQLDIGVAVMQSKYDFAFLKNDARPATVVVHEQFDSVDERDAWRQQFVSTHGGPNNAGKVAFTETSPNGSTPKDSMLIQTLGMTSKDAQMVQRHAEKLAAIEVAFGVPRSRLGDASARTFANTSEEWAGYWQTTIRNLCLEIADEVNTHLAPKFGLDVCWFDFSGNAALRDEPPFPVEQAPTIVAAGLASVNEARTKVLFLPPLDDEKADTLKGMEPEPEPEPPEEDDNEDDEGATPPEATGEADPNDDESDRSVSAAAVCRLRQFNAQRATQRALPDMGEGIMQAMSRDDRVRAILRTVERDTERLEKRWDRRWASFFKKQAAATLARVEGKRGRQALNREAARTLGPVLQRDPQTDAIFDPAFWRSATLEHAVEMYSDILDVSLAAYEAKFGISLDLEAVWAKDFIGRRSNQLAGQVTNTTYRNIQKALAEGVANGESIPDLAARIEGTFSTSKSRATTIARTETISAYNGGTQEAIKNTPADVTAGMEWIAALDERTRLAHADADGQIVRVGQSFTVDGEDLEYPGDPSGSAENVINCRCTVAPVVPEDMPNETSADFTS